MNHMCMYKDVFNNFKQVDEFIKKEETSKAVSLLDTIEYDIRKFDDDAYYKDWVDVVLCTIGLKRNIMKIHE